MTDHILDITKWKKEYPFLNEVSYVYDKFNSNEYADLNEGLYDSLCHTIIRSVNENVVKYKDVCKKLMRNLEYFTLNLIYYEISSDRCNILFHWLYNLLDKGNFTYDIIDKCFETYDDHILKKGNTNMKCFYYKDNKLYEPTKITLLDIFDNNMNNIEKLLKTEREEIKFLCRKFVCECLKIYKYMNETYCLKSSEKSPKHTDTCLKLSLFSSSYNIFNSKLVGIDPKIPSLDNIYSECLDERPLSQQEDPLGLRGKGYRSRPSGDVLTEGSTDTDRDLAVSLPQPLENGDSSMKSITTTIGTVAGASSLLALLYKVNTKIHLNIRTIIYKCVYTKYT
ncbi:hypothetical protein PVMG_04592 [Plasmodium vivax Mauritania I]|uniref:Variable surface protein n=1 Tax=Plasmodium vivax Mauritania I TaxID=1035515 RepID=A0A0J9T552_PLAVI|nr:hypothetical protein PVMG_04592 [Plasmodium vivax Mauritania I]